MRTLVVCLVSLSCASTQDGLKSQPIIGEAMPADAGATTHPETKKPMAPPTRTQVISDMVHGLTLKDPYRWLEDEKAPEVQAWMKAQDDHARSNLRALPGLEWLRKRYAELYYLDAISVPIKRGGRMFYARQKKDKEKAIVYWRDPNGVEHMLLDPNVWSNDNTVSLGTWVPSWDGKKVVFAEKPNAADEATLYVLDVDSGERSKVDVIVGGKYASPSWLPDSKSFIYEWLPTDEKIPVSERPGTCEVRKHVLGQDPAKDEQIHPRTGDAKTFMSGQVSRDGKWLFVSILRGWNENDVFFKKVGVDTEWRLLVKGKDAKYGVEAWKDVFYVFTDEGAPNKRLFAVDPKKSDRSNWKEILSEDKEAARESFAIVGGHFAIGALKKAVSVVEVFDFKGKKIRTVELPGLGTASNLIGNEDEDEAYFAFSSFTMPRQVFKTSMKSGKTELWASTDVPVDPTKYEVRQVFYPSKDGTRVSMFIVARKDVVLDGNNPVLLYGYGGFDVSLTSAFTAFIYPWLEAGGVYAVPNLRGGGEYGKAWHDAGKGANKQNVFDDIAAAAEYLVKEKWTTSKRLAIRGGSNGGLLVGTAMTQRPELYGAVICAVPLLDMVRYHLYGSGKTWIPEYGDPEKADELKVLAAYSPYHHVKEHATYPPLLMMSADHDDRVDPFHARKFVAMVQGMTKGQGTAWLRIEMHAGHGGADQVAKSIESSVDQIAFLFSTLGVTPPSVPPTLSN
jgi:prolyl oligopeptidase